MQNVPIPPEFVQDPPAVNQPEIAHIVGRDPERTPMQWDTSPNVGFADPGIQTWLPTSSDYAQVNAATQSSKPKSMLAFYRALTRLRQSETALTVGEFASIDVDNADIFAYTRRDGSGNSFLTAPNLGERSSTIDLGAVAQGASVALSTTMERDGEVDLSAISIAANEGVILRLKE